MASTVTRIDCPVSGVARWIGTDTTDPATVLSAIGGSATCSETPPADTERDVGTEWLPSATTPRSRVSKVSGAARSYWTH